MTAAAAKPVFLSYARSTSSGAAHALFDALGEELCFFDQEDLGPRDDFPRRLSDALLGSRAVVVFPDERYFERWYCLREWLLATAPWAALGRPLDGPDSLRAVEHLFIALPPAGMDRRDQERLPPPLQDENLLSAGDPAALAAWLRERLTGPTLGERFDALRVSTARRELLTDPRAIPHPPLKMNGVACNLDDLRPSIGERFVGRRDEMWQLHEHLSTQRPGGQEVAALTGALKGGGGFGKTRLAIEYARRMGPAEYPGGVFWIDGSEPERIGDAWRRVLLAAWPEERRAAVTELPEIELRDALRRALETRASEGEVLVVVDNLPEAAPGEPPPAIADLCPALGEVTCLVTSRSLVGYGESVQHSITIEVLDEAAALQLLRREVTAALADAEWLEIATWTGRLPLALELLNGLLTADVPVSELLARARGEEEVAEALDRYADTLRGEVPEGSRLGIAEVFELSCSRLTPDALELVRRLAWCAPEPIPIELVRDLAPEGSFEGARAQLVRRSFLTWDEGKGAMVLHRVLASFLRGGGDQTAMRRMVLEALRERYREAAVDDSTQRPLLLQLLPHIDVQHAWPRRHGSAGEESFLDSVLDRLRVLGERGSEASPLVSVRMACHWLIAQRDRGTDAAGWARAHGNLGNALQAIGEREGSPETLGRAVAAFEAALEVYTQDALPLQWAMAQNNLGIALSVLGAREGSPETLGRAVAAYESALEVYTQDSLPLDWAMTQNNLGNALQAIGEREGSPETLGRAVAAFEAALEVYTQDALPLDWAMTQNNLGNALRVLGEREGSPETLGRAVAAFEAALEVYTQDALPLQWAMAQNNLGNALRILGEHEGSPETLGRAVAAFEAALEVYTQDALPLQWAVAQNNLGNALRVLGEREGSPETLGRAVAAFEAALEVYTQDALPLQWAMTQNNLGNALQAIGEREGSPETLGRAVAAFEAALEVRTQDALPLQWAMTQNNLGNALQAIGEREGSPETLGRAVAAFEAALEVYTPDALPLQWAMTQNNLGTALQAIGEREGSPETLGRAVAAYEAALEVFEAGGIQAYSEIASRNAERAADLLRGLLEDGEAPSSEEV